MKTSTFLLLLPLLLSGCDSYLGPLGAVGSYTLESIGDRPLPAISTQNEHVTITTVADTLHITDGQRGVHVRHQSVERPTDPTGPVLMRQESDFTYRIEGARIEISYHCPPNALALCMAGPHLFGRAERGRLWLDTAFASERHIYRSVQGS